MNKRWDTQTKKVNKKLLENSIMLYIMKFSGYFFSLAVVPYQTRVLSKQCYGGLSLAQGLMMYFTILIDFGFMVSGVTEVSNNQNDRRKLSECLTSVLIIRIGLSLLSVGILSGVILLIPSYTPWAIAFYIYLAAVILESLLPMFFLRGMEDMRTVAFLTLLSKAVTTALIFIAVKSDTEYLLVPCMRLAGAVLSFGIAWLYIRKKYKVGLIKVSKEKIFSTLREAFGFFISRVSTAVYRYGNTVILGAAMPATAVAMYACPAKLMDIGMTMSSPISDSLLPYISKTRDYKSAWRMMLIIAPWIIFGGTVGFIWAEPIISLIFGDKYVESAGVLRILIPIIAITPINYILEYPVMVPMGLKNQSNLASIVGMIVYVSGMFLLLCADHITIIGAAVVLLLSEYGAAGWRVVIVLKHRNRLMNQ